MSGNKKPRATSDGIYPIHPSHGSVTRVVYREQSMPIRDTGQSPHSEGWLTNCEFWPAQHVGGLSWTWVELGGDWCILRQVKNRGETRVGHSIY